MAIESKEVVGYAYSMLENDSPEMVIRNIINRAYYGAFLTARDNAGITNSSGSVHQDVSNHYKSRKPRVTNNLDALRRLRQKADYQPKGDMTIHNARESCTKARRVIQDLEAPTESNNS